MNYMQEAKEESCRSGSGSGYTSKAPVTVNTLHDQKNLMLFQLSQFSVSRPKSRLRKGQVQAQVVGTGLVNRTNSEEIISPNNRCRRSHLDGEESKAYSCSTLYLPFGQNQPHMRRKSNCVRQTCETASTIRSQQPLLLSNPPAITTLLLLGGSSSFTSPPPPSPQFQSHSKFSAQCTISNGTTTH